MRETMSPSLLPFLGVWVSGCAAMMLPSLVPTTALVRHIGASVAVFIATYLSVWGALGVVAFSAVRAFEGNRFAAIAALAFAALYQVSPVKRASLLRCRSPLRVLMHPAFGAGLRYARDCVGCCAGLMLAFVALGAQNMLWMALAAAAIFLEKATPLGTRASAPLAALVAALALAVTL